MEEELSMHTFTCVSRPVAHHRFVGCVSTASQPNWRQQPRPTRPTGTRKQTGHSTQIQLDIAHRMKKFAGKLEQTAASYTHHKDSLSVSFSVITDLNEPRPRRSTHMCSGSRLMLLSPGSVSSCSRGVHFCMLTARLCGVETIGVRSSSRGWWIREVSAPPPPRACSWCVPCAAVLFAMKRGSRRRRRAQAAALSDSGRSTPFGPHDRTDGEMGGGEA
jgi:hypothetical protein